VDKSFSIFERNRVFKSKHSSKSSIVCANPENRIQIEKRQLSTCKLQGAPFRTETACPVKHHIHRSLLIFRILFDCRIKKSRSGQHVKLGRFLRIAPLMRYRWLRFAFSSRFIGTEICDETDVTPRILLNAIATVHTGPASVPNASDETIDRIAKSTQDCSSFTFLIFL